MKSVFITGLVAILLGIAALAYQGINYTTEKEILDIGPLEATTESEKTIPLPPIVGISLLLAGTAMVIYSRRR
jgi:hypothetical protein